MLGGRGVEIDLGLGLHLGCIKAAAFTVVRNRHSRIWLSPHTHPVSSKRLNFGFDEGAILYLARLLAV